jgi:V8-like Glu-specific endopeptidase
MPKFTIITGILILGLSIISFGQIAEIPMYTEKFETHSGYLSGNPNHTKAELAHIEIVGIAGVPWLNVNFVNYDFGVASYIIITSLKDGLWQKHNQLTLEQWEGFSAYFNGDFVEIKFYVAPEDKNVFYRIEEVIIGEWEGGTESQCGPTDDRLESFDKRTGRLMSIGCTAWLIPNGKFVSAGHCLTGTNSSTMQFNVPRSLSGGTVQHPGPQDQYAVISTSKIYTNGGVGNDWGVFAVSPNSVTGLMPAAAQGSVFYLERNYAIGDSIRITGYGTDTNTPIFNQVQQTHIGPNANSSGTTMRYVTDTEGGNSGSPIIHGGTDVALGVHTHGGCSTTGSGNNNGTSFFHTAFWDAVEQGVPVEMVSFNASVDVNSVTLSWITATELNNKGFSVERKLVNENSWTEIVFINGYGTTTEAQVYTYIDIHSAADVYIYRLKQIDFDGSVTYSKEIQVEVAGIADYSLYQNYPNPFNPSTVIKFRLSENSFVSLKVYDQLGRVVDILVNDELPAGEQKIEFNTSGKNLSSGVYFYQLITDRKTDIRKMMLMK